MAELIKFIQGGFEDEEKADFYNNKIKKVDFLCVDDLGKEYRNLKNSGSFVTAEFDILMRFRKGSLLPSILTTNLGDTEFKKFYGDSVDSLLTSCNKRLIVMGDDFRGKQGKKWDKLLNNISDDLQTA
jgi:DNA replication protein DnaC